MRKLISFLLLLAVPAFAGKWTIIWDDPNIPKCPQYEVFEVVGNTTNSLGIVNTTNIVLNSVTPTQHTYQVQAISAEGIRSDPAIGVFVFPSSVRNVSVK
jgi:hypothetical protein